ncbi:MAG TPA: hypothetical protein VK866_12960, partial [Acidimicrobiales bacterium]|nr:hypothetical protein [Acidimicrobiales bacterium]
MSRNRVAVLIASALAVGALAAVAVDELLDDDVSLTATPAGDVSAPADEAAGDVPAPVAEAPVGETPVAEAPVAEAPAADSSAGAVSGEQAAAIGAAAAGGTAIDVWPGTEGGR